MQKPELACPCPLRLLYDSRKYISFANREDRSTHRHHYRIARMASLWRAYVTATLQTWFGGVCGSVVRWGLRSLLVMVLFLVSGLVLLCVYDIFGSSRDKSVTRSCWISAKQVVGKTQLWSMLALFRDASVGGASRMSKKEGVDRKPDVRDSCVLI
jgi:hypothetical protein